MAEEKDIIGREEPLNEDASTPETADEAADETPAAGPQGKAGKFDRLTQGEGTGFRPSSTWGTARSRITYEA